MLTFIVPVYNSLEFINSFLITIQRQINKEFKILFINDGSTDCTVEFLEYYFRNNHNVRILSKPNGGPSSARNYGIKNVDTPYFMFLDPDDGISANYVDSIINAIEKGYINIYTAPAYIDDMKECLNTELYKNNSISNISKKQITPLDMNRLVFCTDTVRKFNLYMDDISNFEGELFCIKYTSLTKLESVNILSSAYHLHYKRPNSLTRSDKQLKRFEDSLPTLKSYKGTFENPELNELISQFIHKTERWITEIKK